jgi:hypothetical protein
VHSLGGPAASVELLPGGQRLKCSGLRSILFGQLNLRWIGGIIGRHLELAAYHYGKRT